jgi:phosphoglycolate phosphatase
MTKNLRAVIFDLDDTLIRSNINFMEMRSALIDFLTSNLPFAIELDTSKSTYEIIQYAIAVLNEHGLSNIVSNVTTKLNRVMTGIEMKYVSNAKPIEGAVEALSTLRNKGVKIGILTRSCRKYTDDVLRATALSGFVDEVAARDDSDTPKPDPSQVYYLMKRMNVKPTDVVMVGDHTVDQLCARNAGVRFIGVLTGRLANEQHEKLGETVVPSVRELPNILDP